MTSLYTHRRLFALLHDIAVALLAFWLALYLRVSGHFEELPTGSAALASVLFTVTCACVFLGFGVYRSIWAFASLRDLAQIVRAATSAVALFLALGFVTTRLEGVPRTVPFMAWFIMLAGLGGSRMLFRVLRERRLTALWERSGAGRVNVLLIGAGDDADLFMRAVTSNPQSPYHVVGIVGENAKRVGRSIGGVDVVGTVDQLPAVIANLRARMKAPTRLILTRAVTRFNGPAIAQILEQATALGLSLSRLPALTDLRDDVGNAVVQDKPLALEDLLGRPEAKLNHKDIRSLIRGRRVLVTGSGGTIGAELARQIAALEPSHLVLVESSEFNLYRIEMELREARPYQELSALLGDVRDAVRIRQIFTEARPELVFHAAAIKHVPIAEVNIRETVLTNAIGTRIVADCAAAAGCAAMVLISTDKAVKPSSVMGATKRLAEMYCQALDLSAQRTRFVTVRFGNVLGSTGSVVPRFKEQLARGGPLTVTHPDITRYFMTVREAVELVLQASALGIRPEDERGKLLVLDMGEPVKIADLARQMIRLAGLRPDEDIKIAYTGLRPGEKLHEELFAPEEAPIPSAAEGVQIARATTVPLERLQTTLSDYADALRDGMTEAEAQKTLAGLVIDFRSGV